MTLSHLPTQILASVTYSVPAANGIFKTRRSMRSRLSVIGIMPVLETIYEDGTATNTASPSQCHPRKVNSPTQKSPRGSKRTSYCKHSLSVPEQTVTALSVSALSCAQCGAAPNLSQAYVDLKRFMDNGHKCELSSACILPPFLRLTALVCLSTDSTSGITLEVFALGGTSVIHTEHFFEEAFSPEEAKWD